MDRIFKSKTDVPYTILSNEVLKDNTLSMQAKGLFAYLQSLPPDWVINKNELIRNHTNGKHSTINAFKELEDKGLVIKVEQIRKNGMFSHNEYCVYPNYSHLTDDRKTDNGEPMNGKPTTVNQPLLIKDNTNYRLTNKRNIQRAHAIPEFEEFKEYALKKKPNADAEALRLKYESWLENDWMTGGDKPRKIKNWKTTLSNTLPYIKEVKEQLSEYEKLIKGWR